MTFANFVPCDCKKCKCRAETKNDNRVCSFCLAGNHEEQKRD